MTTLRAVRGARAGGSSPGIEKSGHRGANPLAASGRPSGPAPLRVVRSLSAERQTSPPASVALHVSPPSWPRWWLLTGAAGLVALGGCALHRFRLERMLELQRIRTRIATDLHDEIGSSLTQIAILSEVAERTLKGPDAAAAEPIGRVSLISRELVDSMSEIVWAINPRNDRVQDLASRMRRFAADMLSGSRIALRFRTPDGVQHVVIAADLRRQVLLIFKEAIHNAVRHSGCTGVRVDLELERGRLLLSIADNGRGFDRRHTPAGHGLDSMEARANSLDGHLEIAAAPGRGTAVRAVIPLSRRAPRARKAT